MKSVLKFLLFPGLGYPTVLIWHLIFGGILGALVMACFGFRGDFVGGFSLWHSFIGPVIVMIAAAYVARRW